MRYGYRCPEHGELETDFAADRVWCPHPDCRIAAKRIWNFIIDSSFEPYFAPSFGTIVKSRTHAKDLAKIASEEQTLRTGIPHNYEVVDTHDDEAVGVDTEHKKAVAEDSRRFAVNGAAWSQERLAEIKRAKAEVTASRQKVDA